MKEMQTQLRDQNIALNAASIVAETDLSGRITYVNDAFCKISKYSREELLGQSHKIINSGFHDKEFFANLWSTIRGGNIWKGQIQNKAKDGAPYWVDTTIVPFKNSQGKIYKYVAVRHEITELKFLQDMLPNKIKLAEKHLKSSRAKAKALQELSHDIRNSLNHVLVAVEFLKYEIKDEDKRKLLIYPMESSVNYMAHVLEDVLEGSRLEANKIELSVSPCQIRKILNEVKDMFSLSAKTKGVSIKVNCDDELPESVYCDPYRLVQILQNFMSNALKFTSEGEIVIGAKKLAQLNNRVKISFYVKDTGRGISSEEKKKLFKEFGQVYSSDSRAGTGIGLTICKKLADLMEGEIKVESEKSKGSMFSLEVLFRAV